MTWQEGNPRTFKEMCAVVTEASKKDIGRCYNFIVKELEQVCACIPCSRCLPLRAVQVAVTAAAVGRSDRVFGGVQCPAACWKECRLTNPVSKDLLLSVQAMSSVNPADYIRRFSSHLMLDPQDMRVRSHDVLV